MAPSSVTLGPRLHPATPYEKMLEGSECPLEEEAGTEMGHKSHFTEEKIEAQRFAQYTQLTGGRG